MSGFHNRERTAARAILVAFAVCFTASMAFAAPVTVLNPGFENIAGESPYNEFTFGPLAGWDLYDPENITGGGAGPTFYLGTLTPFQPDPLGNPGVYANFPAGAPEGQRVGIAFSFAGSGDQGEWGFIQTLSDVLLANTQYQLQVEIGNIASATATDGTFFPLSGFPGYRVDLLAGDEVIASDNNSLAGLIPDGAFATSTLNFMTGAAHDQLGETLAIRLVNLNVVDPLFPDSDLEVDFDNVRLTATAVPEASSLALLGSVGLVLIGWRRRRQSA
jgi:hypothetical protein